MTFTKIAKFFHNSTVLQLTSIFCLGLFGIYFALAMGELIPVNNGTGFDGRTYADIIKNFQHVIFSEGLSSYRILRIFPCFIAYLVLKVLHIGSSDRNIVGFFEFYNLSLILIGTYLWSLIARELKLSQRGNWLGFCGLFLGYAALKIPFFYPILTDTTAFTLGMFLVYFYLKRNTVGMLLTMIAGFFTWPNFFELGTILLVFPRKEEVEDKSGDSKLGFFMSLASGLLVIVGAVYVFIGIRHTWSGSETSWDFLPLSILLTSVLVFFGFYYLFKPKYLFNIKKIRNALNFRNLIIALVVFALLKLAIFFYTSQFTFSDASYLSRLKYFIINLFYLGNRQPLVSLISHMNFFGPIVLLLVFYWKSFCRTIRTFGYGLVAFIAVGFILSLFPESRLILNIFPFFIVFLALSLDEFKWDKTAYVFLGLYSLLISKFWLYISYGLTESNVDLLKFPWQKWAMDSGYYLSNLGYVIELAVFVISAITLYVVFKSERNHEEQN